MKWRATPDPDLIESPPYFIRRWPDVGRYVLGRDLGKQIAECLGGFDSGDEAKRAAEELNREEGKYAPAQCAASDVPGVAGSGAG